MNDHNNNYYGRECVKPPPSVYMWERICQSNRQSTLSVCTFFEFFSLKNTGKCAEILKKTFRKSDQFLSEISEKNVRNFGKKSKIRAVGKNCLLGR